MQDSLHEEMFADHAWQEMHQILDREMPQRNRRGAFWWWFLPVFGLGMLLGQDTLMDGKIPVATAKRQQNKPAIAQLEKYPGQNAGKPSKTKLAEPNSKPAQSIGQHAETIATLRPERVGGDAHKSGKNPQHANQLLPQNLAVKPETNTPSSEARPENTAYNQAEELPTPSPSGTVQPVDSSNAELTNLWINTSQVVAMREPNLNEPERVLEQVNIKPQRAKQKLEWWAEAGTQLATGTSGLSGYRAGLMNAIPMGRMRLQTELAYEKTEVGFQSVQRDVLTGQENFSAVKLTSPDNLGLGVSSGQQNAQSVSRITLQFINLNLALYHPVGKRFGLALGGNVHYLGGIKVGDQYLRSTLFDNVENSYQLAPGNTNKVTPQQGDALSKESFRAFGFSAQGVLSYRIATRWSANLGHRQSLQHFTKTSDLLLKPNWVDFGVRYRIK